MLSTETAVVQRISAVGILADVGFGCTKLGVGTACASPALVADGAHSLADVLVGAVSYGAYAAARAPPDDDHPYGHGKFEAGGSLVVGAALVATGAAAAANAATMATAAPDVMTLPAVTACAGVAALSIAGKEWLYRATLRAGERGRSDAIVANAHHHRSDAYASIATLGGIVGTYALGVPWLDPLAAAGVAAVVAHQGVHICRDAVDQLLDASFDPARLEQLRDAVSETLGPEYVVERLRARKAGPGIVADLVLTVPAGLSASAAHQVGEHGAVALRRAAQEAGVAVADVQVHLDPSDRQERDTRLAALPSTLEKRVTARALRHPRVRGVAHCVVRYDNTKVLAKVDVILPDAMTLRAAHGVAGALRRSILRGVPELHEVDVDCELDERRARTSRRGVGRGRHTSCM